MPLNYQEAADTQPEVATELIAVTGVTQHIQVVKVAAGPPGEYQGNLLFGNQPAASSLCVILSSQQGYLDVHADTHFTERTLTADGEFDGTTLSQIVVRPFLFNGTEWDRARGSISYGQEVHITRIEPEIVPQIGHYVFMSGAAYQLPSVSGNRGVLIKNSVDSSGTVYLGTSSVSRYKGIELFTGEAVSLPINNSNLLYATGTSIIQILDIFAL